MVFIATVQPNTFQDELLEQILVQVSPFMMVRLKHPEEKHGRVMQGAVIEKPRDIPTAAEVLFMPGTRGLVV